MNKSNILQILSITFFLTSFVSYTANSLEFIPLSEKASFIDGENLITMTPTSDDIQADFPDTIEQCIAGISTVKVDKDGTQYVTNVSQKDYKIFAQAIKQLEASGLSSSLFSSPGAPPSNTLPIEHKYAPTVVIGVDDRIRIHNTTVSPYYYIGRIAVGCSGTLVGARHVLTAGHCVSKGNGTWYSSLNFTVGQNGSYKPWGSENWVTALTTSAWFNNADSRYDYGMIILSAAPHGGWSGYGVYSGGSHHLTGYPGDKPFGTMWTHSGPTRASAFQIHYTIDTAGGQSGSGVRDRSNVIRGIHTLGSPRGNSGTRMTTGVFNTVKNWIATH